MILKGQPNLYEIITTLAVLVFDIRCSFSDILEVWLTDTLHEGL